MKTFSLSFLHTLLFLSLLGLVLCNCESDLTTGQPTEELQLKSGLTATDSNGNDTQGLVTFVEDCEDCEYRIANVSNQIPASALGGGNIFTGPGDIRLTLFYSENGDFQWHRNIDGSTGLFPSPWIAADEFFEKRRISFHNFPLDMPISIIQNSYPDFTLHFEVRCPYLRDGNGQVIEYLYSTEDRRFLDFTDVRTSVVWDHTPLARSCPPDLPEPKNGLSLDEPE